MIEDDRQEDEISLLDLMLVVAENLKLLVLGPLLAGLLAIGIGFLLPQTYTSIATFRVGDGGKSIDEVMKTRTVLSAAVNRWQPNLMPPAGTDAEAKLLKAIRFKPALGQKTGVSLAHMEVDGDSPAAAQAFANALIDAWLESTIPPPLTRTELERKLKINKESLDSVGKIVDRQTAESAKNELPKLQYDMAGSMASLMQLRNGYVEAIAGIEAQLKGASRDMVFSAPTLPVQAISSNKALMAILTSLGTGVALLLFVFMRQAWRNAALNPQAAQKQARLRAVFAACVGK